MRASTYNIKVEVDSENKLYAVLNGYTRAFDIVKENVYTYLSTDGMSGNVSDETKRKLIERGYLTSLPKNEEIKLVKNLLDRIYNEIRLKYYSFQFIISYDCNLRCVYCYEDPVLNGNACLSKRKITREQIDKAFEIIIEKNEDNIGKKVIALYGGEPFLAENYESIVYIVERGKQLGYTFSVTSNGYDIDKYLDFIQNNKIFSFQITLDGVDDIQNIRKPHYKNKDSFFKITNNIDSLLKIGVPVTIRVNTDPYTMGRIEELLNYFEEKGWYKYANFKSYTALLRKNVPIKESNFAASREIFTQSDFYRSFYEKRIYDKSHHKMECQDYKTYNMLKNLLLGKYVPYKTCFCGAQSGCIIFDPMGDVYSCWDVVGQRQYRVGKYFPKFELEDDLSNKWFNSRVSEYKCAYCKYVFFCGGGCLAGSLRMNGEIKPGDCNDYPNLFNYELQIIYKEQIKRGLDGRKEFIEG